MVVVAAAAIGGHRGARPAPPQYQTLKNEGAWRFVLPRVKLSAGRAVPGGGIAANIAKLPELLQKTS